MQGHQFHGGRFRTRLSLRHLAARLEHHLTSPPSHRPGTRGTIDGATKRQKILHIDIPFLVPIAVMMLILSCGSLLGSNTDKALLMQTPGNMTTSDIIGVYVYEMGLSKAQFSYTSAIGLFVNLINFLMILSVNWVSRRLSETSLF